MMREEEVVQGAICMVTSPMSWAPDQTWYPRIGDLFVIELDPRPGPYATLVRVRRIYDAYSTDLTLNDILWGCTSQAKPIVLPPSPPRRTAWERILGDDD